MVCLQDGRILVYGGFCKEKKSGGGRKKEAEEEGKTMGDMYLLVPESKFIIWYSLKHQVMAESSVDFPNSRNDY